MPGDLDLPARELEESGGGKTLVIGSVPDGTALKRVGDTIVGASLTGAALPAGWYNVRDFGAVGNGVANDLPAFTLAVANGGTVIVPPGVYRLVGNLDLIKATKLLGGPNGGGNAGIQLSFSEGCGIRVHSTESYTAAIGANAQGSIIDGIRLTGEMPRNVQGGGSQPPRWTANTAYVIGQRVAMYRDFVGDATKIQGMRFFYWECVKAGTSGGTLPDLQESTAFPSVFGCYYGSWEIDNVLQIWQAGKAYGSGHVVRRTSGTYDWIFVAQGGGVSGAQAPAWQFGDGATTLDGTVTWRTRPSTPYYWTDGTVIWAARVHAAVKMYLFAEVTNCYLDGWMNAAISCVGDDGLYPAANCIGWLASKNVYGSCGTGICVRGTRSHLGLAERNEFGLIGEEFNGTALDWTYGTDRGGNGGISVLDMSYYGCTWIVPVSEFSYDRAFVLDGVRQFGNLIGAWDEGTALLNGAYLGQQNTVQQGWLPLIDPRSLAASTRYRDFRQVEEVNYASPRQTRAKLHDSGADYVFRWESNRAYPLNSGANELGWAWREFAGYPIAGEWMMQYGVTGVGYDAYSLLDGFHGLGSGWRDPAGHFGGASGREYFLGLDNGQERSNIPRRGYRPVGDRFEPRIDTFGSGAARGRYLGRVVTTRGFRGVDTWPYPGPTVVRQFQDQQGGAPTTVEYGGYVFVCTQAGTTNGTPPTAAMDAAIAARGASVSAMLAAGEIESTWVATSVQQINFVKRTSTRVGSPAKYYLFRCTARDTAAAGTWPVTGAVEPNWSTALNIGNTLVDNQITWTCLGPDPDDAMVVVDGSAQWVCAGAVATFAEYGPIYEKGSTTTPDATPKAIDTYALDDNAVNHFDVVVTAFSAADGMSFVLRGAWRRVGATVTILGAVAVDSRGAAGWTATLAVSGTNVEVRGTGAGGTSITWNATRRPK